LVKIYFCEIHQSSIHNHQFCPIVNRQSTIVNCFPAHILTQVLSFWGNLSYNIKTRKFIGKEQRMLLVRQIDAENASDLIYECYDNSRKVGKLVARLRSDGMLEACLEETIRREAGRVLVAKLERDAVAHGLAGMYFTARNEKERDEFLPAGYEPVAQTNLLLFKSFRRAEP
jgi:hypothetical protein